MRLAFFVTIALNFFPATGTPIPNIRLELFALDLRPEKERAATSAALSFRL
ncbi:MAG TPA: hypothetical protein VKG24_03740 [Pseudolabrys sp.]|jgi:hypothetical protein|nr:hypothetical protein [Pseudolabrys sp.]